MLSPLTRLLGACAVLSVAAAVLNGEDVASISEYPYLVAILDEGSNICGGSLIQLGVVLTAAHCVHGTPAKDLQVRAAALYRIAKGTRVQKLPVLRNIVHEQYDPKTQEHDIAILKTNGKFTRGTLIDTIDLPAPGVDYDLKMGTVMGWGDMLNGKVATVLQKARLPILGSARCAPFYADGMIFSTNYCNYDNTETKTLCNGDSGGPVAIHFQTKRDIIAGINSWVHENDNHCSAEYPSVATNVGKYLDWINKYLKQFASQTPTQKPGQNVRPSSTSRPQNNRPNSPTMRQNNRPNSPTMRQNNRPNSPTMRQNNRPNSSNKSQNNRPAPSIKPKNNGR